MKVGDLVQLNLSVIHRPHSRVGPNPVALVVDYNDGDLLDGIPTGSWVLLYNGSTDKKIYVVNQDLWEVI